MAGSREIRLRAERRAADFRTTVAAADRAIKRAQGEIGNIIRLDTDAGRHQLDRLIDALRRVREALREQRACDECGAPFVLVDPRQVFCSDTCRFRAAKRRTRALGKATG